MLLTKGRNSSPNVVGRYMNNIKKPSREWAELFMFWAESTKRGINCFRCLIF